MITNNLLKKKKQNKKNTTPSNLEQLEQNSLSIAYKTTFFSEEFIHSCLVDTTLVVGSDISLTITTNTLRSTKHFLLNQYQILHLLLK